MDDIFTCPECQKEFRESEATTQIRNMNFRTGDDSIQATSLILCPACKHVAIAIFDSMTCSSLLGE